MATIHCWEGSSLLTRWDCGELRKQSIWVIFSGRLYWLHIALRLSRHNWVYGALSQLGHSKSKPWLYNQCFWPSLTTMRKDSYWNYANTYIGIKIVRTVTETSWILEESGMEKKNKSYIGIQRYIFCHSCKSVKRKFSYICKKQNIFKRFYLNSSY